MIKRLLSLTTLALSLNALAQDSTSQKQLDEVVVTATKYPVKTSQTGKVITIISREQLDRSAGKDLSQLLTEQAGVTVNSSYSNPGKDKSIFLRGAKSEYTLITIDGVPVYDATSSTSNFDLRLIPIDFIERIEILKGSQSTLYGSDAIAGVINIITRKGGDKVFSPFATFTYGTYKSKKINAGVQGSKDKFSYNAAYTYSKTDGISEATDKFNTGKFDEDGFTQNSLHVNLGFTPTSNIKIAPYIRYSHFDGRLDADAFADDKDYKYELKNMQAGVINNFTFNKVRLTVSYNYTHTRRDYFNDSLIKESAFDGYSTGYYKSMEHLADAYVSFPVTPSLTFTGGADFRQSQTQVNTFGVYKYEYNGAIFSGSYKSAISDDSAKQSQEGVYGAFTFAHSGFTVEAGGRFNHHSVYGDNWVFNINPSVLVNRQLKLFVNLSSAYKVPTLYQLYSEYHNPFKALDPEKALTLEGGTQYYAPNNLLTARVAVFKRWVKNGIAFYTDPSTFASYYINQDKQNDWGYEIEPAINIGKDGQLLLSYAYVDGKITTPNNGKDTSFFNLIRRPKVVFGATANYRILPELFASIAYRHIGKRTDTDFSAFPAQTVNLHSYDLLNGYIEYTFYKKMKVFADIKNITNKTYYEVYGYNAQGRNYTVGISLRL